MSEDNNENSALVPRLRFPEFREVNNWKLEPLGRLAKRRAAKNAKGEYVRVLTNSAEFGVVDQRDYFEKDIASQGSLEGYYIVEKGDYVYNPRISTSAPVGPLSKNNVGTGVMSPLYTVFRFISSDNDFFAHYFKSTHWHHYMRQASSTGARHDRMSITNDDFMGLPLPVSTPKEQQKIADCLSSIDELITAETKTLDALKTHKQGLMQQLFPREGETVPRLRFPEFRDAGEWEEVALGDVCDRIMDGTHFSPASKSGPFLYLTSKNVRPGALVLEDVSYISEDEHRSIFARCPVRKNDLLLTKDGASTGNCALNPLDFEFSLLSSVAVIRGDDEKILQEFLAQDFQSRHIQNQIADAISGQAITRITLEKIRLFKVWLTSPREQQRISDCLASLDDLVTAKSQRIDALKTHKKGLMQQLFPILDEVTT